jgi:Sulfatase
MSGSKSKRNSFPLHVFLAATYPPLALLASNLSEVSANVVFRPLFISLALALGLLLLFWLLMRNGQRAALATSLSVILFFSYGHIYPLLKGVDLGGLFLFRHRTLLVLWVLIGVGGAWFFWRQKLPLESITSGLNLVTLFLVIMPLVQIIYPTMRNAIAEAQVTQPEPVTKRAPGQSAPDVYYIILDAHGRSDILKEHAGYDNSGFIKSLEELGFYVGECSQTNYSLTLLSIASSLNYTYLDDLMGESGGVDLQYYISKSAIRQFLEGLGYKTVAFATGFRMTQLTDADYYYEPGTQKDNEFEAQLLKTTAWIALVDAGIAPEMDSSAENYRDRTLLVLNTLRELPNLEGPKFVFAHIASPHPPYIFDAQGNFHDVGLGEHDEKNITPQEMAPLYRAQVEFIDNQILDVVRTILERSQTPPIIIQGDHGPLVIDKSIRMPILNAYYLPKGEALLYPSISPVNTFRVVLDAYFCQSLPLLEDISRFSLDYRNPFDYRNVPNTCEK